MGLVPPTLLKMHHVMVCMCKNQRSSEGKGDGLLIIIKRKKEQRGGLFCEKGDFLFKFKMKEICTGYNCPFREPFLSQSQRFEYFNGYINIGVGAVATLSLCY